MQFTETDYERLHSLVFRPDYSGYKPTVVEIPNGDGKADTDKRYAHVGLKYLQTEQQKRDLLPYLEAAHEEAIKVATAIDLPFTFCPDIRYGALRVLDYPPGSISNRHEDFDLFTLMMFRDQPERFVSGEAYYGNVAAAEPHALVEARKINPQAHLGQLGELIGLGKATPHEVLASETRQRSIVYFAIPDHEAILPTGTVREWLNRRMKVSRTSFDEYK